MATRNEGNANARPSPACRQVPSLPTDTNAIETACDGASTKNLSYS